MISNFLKVILRSLSRNIFFTALNVFGLAMSLACSLAIYLYIRHQTSFDNFHINTHSIYRVIRESSINGNKYDIGITSGPYASALLNDYPGLIKDATRAYPLEALVNHEGISFIEKRILLADSNFFNFFSFNLKKGKASEVLSQPNYAVVSEVFAERYFGDADPINKTVRLDDRFDIIIKGIMEIPANSHLVFDFVGSIQLIEKETWFNEWWNNGLNTYLRVDQPLVAAQLNANFPSFMDKYFGKDFERVNNKIGLRLEPLKKIYFNNATRYESGVIHGDQKYVFIFAFVAILLVTLASINYTNLSTALAATRGKEVGIRKTLGSARRQIAIQFLAESFVIALTSAVIALGIIQVSMPLLVDTLGFRPGNIFYDVDFLRFSFVILLVITLLGGAYPSLLMAGFNPISIVKREVKGELRFLVLRRGLVVFQFVISIMMITCTVIIGKQLKFMHEKDLGFSKEDVMVIQLNNDLLADKRNAFMEQLKSERNVQAVSAVSSEPGGRIFDASTVRVEGEDKSTRMRTLWADDDLAKTLDLKMLEGRWFAKDFVNERDQSVILNETAVYELGLDLEDAVGKRVILSQFDSVYKQVVGVVGDFHFTSLKEKIEPLIVSYGGAGSLVVRFNTGNLTEMVNTIEAHWNSQASGFPIEWSLLDENIKRLYDQEIRQSDLFNIFSIISVCISCLGILGLTALSAQRRTKEIGIRKVLGANALQICTLLMKDMVLMVVLAIIISLPLGYYLIQQWLDGFAYHVNPGWFWFVASGLTILVIAVLVSGVRSAKSAVSNPVNALRVDG